METTTKYFDAPKMIAAFEKQNGEPISEDTKKLIIAYENVINMAYADGYAAGLEAAHD